MSYTQPAGGTILPAQRNTTVFNPGPVTSPNGLDEFVQAAEQDLAWQKNQLLAATYLNRDFPQWIQQYSTGTLIGPTGIHGDPNVASLQPPNAFVVVVNSTEIGGVTFDVVASGTATSGPAIPVCAVPYYKLIPPPANPAANQIAAPASPAAVTLAPVDLFAMTVASNGQTYMRVK
jgi:hypothetical protein